MRLSEVGEKEVKAIVVECRSVSAAAEVLGVSQASLSQYLNVNKRRAWWLGTRAKWSKERAQARARRYREKKKLRATRKDPRPAIEH